jgi:hypothetical protein
MLSLGSRSNIALKPLKNKKMERLTKEKMGEIALVILKERAKRERIPNANELKRVLGMFLKILVFPKKTWLVSGLIYTKKFLKKQFQAPKKYFW